MTMQVKTPEIYALIESISLHYRSNISNRFTRSALAMLVLDSSTWSLIEELTEKMDNYRYQGYHLDELYSAILAMSKFIVAARKQGINIIRYSSTTDRVSSQDKVFRDMVINNFSSNLDILADLVSKLYERVMVIDKEQARGQKPVYKKYPELNDLGRYLTSHT